MSRTRLAAVMIVASTTAIAGCGGSKPGKGSSALPSAGVQAQTHAPSETTTLTKAQLIARADPICARINSKLKATVVLNVREYATKFPQVASYEETEAAELAALKPPASMAGAWSEMVGSLRKATVYTVEMGKSAEARNMARFRLLVARAVGAREKLKKIAAHYGFKYCRA